MIFVLESWLLKVILKFSQKCVDFRLWDLHGRMSAFSKYDFFNIRWFTDFCRSMVFADFLSWSNSIKCNNQKSIKWAMIPVQVWFDKLRSKGKLISRKLSGCGFANQVRWWFVSESDPCILVHVYCMFLYCCPPPYLLALPIALYLLLLQIGFPYHACAKSKYCTYYIH